MAKMVKTTFEFAGLTEEQISEIQSLAEKFSKENEKKKQYFSIKDPKEAFEVYMKNAKPTTSRKEVWDAAIEWHENKVTGDLKECLR